MPSLPFLIVPLIFLTQLPRPYGLLARAILLVLGMFSIGLYSLITVTEPLAPLDRLSDPIREFWLERFAAEELVPNIGMLVFGLHGIESLVPPALIFAVVLAALVLLSRGNGVRPAQSVNKDG